MPQKDKHSIYVKNELYERGEAKTRTLPVADTVSMGWLFSTFLKMWLADKIEVTMEDLKR